MSTKRVLLWKHSIVVEQDNLTETGNSIHIEQKSITRPTRPEGSRLLTWALRYADMKKTYYMF